MVPMFALLITRIYGTMALHSVKPPLPADLYKAFSRDVTRTNRWLTFWCTALNFIEAGLPPYEAAVKHRGHRCQVG